MACACHGFVSDHPFFVGVQYHPEFLSRPIKPSPPYFGLLLASVGRLPHYLQKGCRLSPRWGSLPLLTPPGCQWEVSEGTVPGLLCSQGVLSVYRPVWSLPTVPDAASTVCWTPWLMLMGAVVFPGTRTHPGVGGLLLPLFPLGVAGLGLMPGTWERPCL